MEVASEPEIKIEYFESQETDNLSDTKNFNDIVITTVINSCDIRFKDTNIDIKTQTTVDLNTNTNTRIVWYKSIDSNGKLLCKFCNLKYITDDSLRCHIKKKHPKEYLQLKKSNLLHRRKTSNICRICNKKFICIADLKTHVDTKHKIDIIKSSCTECDATFSDLNELSKHMYVRHDNKVKLLSLICEICGYRAKKQSHFKQHFISHVDKKILSCQQCDYKTNLISNLRIHETIHANIKSFECGYNHCIYRSSSKASLRGHMLKHFPEKYMLFCDKCSYKTVYKHSLKKHMDSHERNCTRVK